jgi:hypothetical protein
VASGFIADLGGVLGAYAGRTQIVVSGAVDDSLLDANSTRPVHYVCNGCGAISAAVL